MEGEGPYKGLVGSQNSTIDAEFLENYSKKRKEPKTFETGVDLLGSGSDFTVFMQRLGVASSEEGFIFTPSDAVYHYHSIYDTQLWQERYADPGFYRHVCVSLLVSPDTADMLLIGGRCEASGPPSLAVKRFGDPSN